MNKNIKHNYFQCFANCFYDKNIFTKDGISKDELIEALKSQTEDEAWLEAHSKAVDTCMSVLEPDFQNTEDTKWVKKCNRLAVKMLICLNGQYLFNCPDTYFQKDGKI